jgi:hypothetical protein
MHHYDGQAQPPRPHTPTQDPQAFRHGLQKISLPLSQHNCKLLAWRGVRHELADLHQHIPWQSGIVWQKAQQVCRHTLAAPEAVEVL